jgi:hypothetical protein
VSESSLFLQRVEVGLGTGMDFLVRVPKLWRVLLDHAPVERASIPHGFAEATDLETWPAKEAREKRERTLIRTGGGSASFYWRHRSQRAS